MLLESLSPQDRKDAAQLARMGDLSWMLDEHQDQRIYRAYREFEANMHDFEGDGFFNAWMLDAGRQVGKTFVCSLIRAEDCIVWPGSRYLSACATEVSLSEFIIPNLDTISEYIPEDIRPRYLRNHRGMKAGYWFPNKSVIKLVGVDMNPKGLRGPKLDGATLHEAAFFRDLSGIVVSVIQPQFQRGRDPTCILESSAPEDVDHDFDTVFKPSCERRKAYVFMTIHDNTALSKRRIAAIMSAACEISPEKAAREYEGKRTRDKVSTVFPEIAPQMKVLNYVLPPYGVALTTLDPGQVHQFAINFSVYDIACGQVVFLDDWAESNPNSERVAAVVAAREYDLFGTVPNPKLARLPLHDTFNGAGELIAAGWATLLGDDRCAHHAEELHRLAQTATGNEASRFRWYDHTNQCWASNPHFRVSDVQLQLINDLSSIYGMAISPTTKDDLEDTMVLNARSKLSQGKVAFAVADEGPSAEMTFKHCHACTWNKQRTKFAEHNTYAHYDLAACVIYALRYWDTLYNIFPDPPPHLGRGGDSWVGDVVAENSWDEDD